MTGEGTTESGAGPRGELPGSFRGLRRLMRYLFASLLVLVLFVVLAAAGLYLFPPARFITSRVNSLLASELGVPAAVRSIAFDTLDHVLIQGLTVEGLMEIPSIRLDISLSRLLKGRLRISRILLDRPVISLKYEAGSWNLPGKAKARPAIPARRTKEPSGPPQIPVLPLQIDLESFEVRDLAFKLYGPQKLETELDGINLRASAFMGAARSSLRVEIEGSGPDHAFQSYLKIAEPQPLEWRTPVKMHVQLLSEDLDQYTISLSMVAAGSEIHNTDGRAIPDAGLTLLAAVGLKTQSLSVEKFEFALGSMVDMALNAEVADLFRWPRVALHVERFSCELAEISHLVPAIPPSRGTVRISGLSVSLSPLTPGKAPGLVEARGALNIKDAGVFLEDQGLSISGLNLELNAVTGGAGSLPDRQGKLPGEIHASLSARVHAVSLPWARLAGLEGSASAAVPTQGQGKGTMKLDLKASSLAVNMPGWVGVTVPASLAVRTAGNFVSGRITLTSLSALIGDAARIQASGGLDSWRKPRLKAEVEINVVGKEVLPLIPGPMKSRWRIQQLDAAARLKAFLDGALTRELAFERGTLSASLDADIRRIRAGHGEMQKADLHLTLEKAGFTPDGFDKASIQMRFTGQRFQFDRAAFEGVRAELQSTIVSGKSGSRGSIGLRVREAKYIHPAAGTFRTPLALDAAMLGDPFAGSMNFKDISLSLGTAARIKAHGALSSWEKRDFQARFSLTAHIGPLIQLLPAPLLEKIPIRPPDAEAGIEGWVRGSLDQQWVPSAEGGVRLRANAASLHFATPPVSAEMLDVDSNTTFQYSRVKGLKNIEGRHEIRWKTVSLPGAAALDQGKILVISRLRDSSLKNVNVAVNAAAAGISRGGFTLAPEGGLILKAKLKGDFQAGAVDDLTASLYAADLGALEAAFSMKGLGKPARAAVECRIDTMSIFSAIVPRLEKYRLSGSLEASVKADGVLPKPGKIRLPLPIRAVATLNARDLEIHPGEGEPLVRGGTGRMQAKIDPEVFEVRAELGAEDIGAIKLPGNGAFPMKAVVELRMENLEKLQINRIAARMGRALATAEVSGTIQGLGPFLRGGASFSPREILSRISAALEMKFGLNTEKEMEMVSMLRTRGSADIDLSLSMRGGKYVTVKGVLNANPVVVSKGEDIFIGPVLARIPFQKTLVLDKEAGDKKPAGSSIRQTLLFERLRSFSKQQDNLVIDRISIPGLTLTDFRADVAVDEQSIALERFVLSGLDGLIGGSLSLRPAEGGIECTFRANAAGIDLRKLLPSGTLKNAEDSQVNGDITLVLPLKLGLQEDALDLSSVSLTLNITHIGENALDSLLLFIDPREKDPGIASVRMALKFATPSQVSIHLREGLLGMGLQLRSFLATEKIINMSPLQRVPIESLGNFPAIKEMVRKINAPVRALALAGARSLTWDADGKPLLQ
ncbi:MAG: hypothetical protein JRI22_06010 [Deltaproteobacteria bacterium]|nr:hypothetical protein [Deltaproteobacteria bacterium]